jgi:hypothetical protein
VQDESWVLGALVVKSISALTESMALGDRQAIMAILGFLLDNTYEGARFDKTETLATRKTASHAESPG